MKLQLPPDIRREAVLSVQRYLRENLVEDAGELASQQLLDFMLEELGPTIHNQAMASLGVGLQQRLEDLGAELLLDEFPYWPTQTRRRKQR